MRLLRAFAGAVAVLAIATPARAQVSVAGMNVQGEIEAGLRLLPDRPSDRDRGKWEEYRDFTQGPFLQGLQLRLFRPDESYFFTFSGAKWGQQDQEYSLGGGRLGLWEGRFDWDQTPHIFTTTARLLATEVAPNVFVLPTPRPALETHNAAPRLDEVGVRWDTARFSFVVTPTPELELRAEYTRIKKDGERPFSMAFGSPGGNFYETLEPIDQTVHDLRLRASYATERWQIQGGYTFSAFENAFSHLTVDNPCSGLAACAGDANGPATGANSLPPSNQAHTLNLAGGINLPYRTRITGNAAYSIRLQNETFLPHTINSALSGAPVLALPQKSLDGVVGTALVNLNATSRPIQPLTLGLKFRMFNLTDWSDEPIFAGHVVNDRTLEEEQRTSPRFGYTRYNLDMDGRWTFSQPLAVILGSGWERWDRVDHREAPRSDEVYLKAALDYKPLDWLAARLTYRPSFRRISEYNTFAHHDHVVLEEEGAATVLQGQSTLLRKFDEADRDRQRVDVLLQMFPLDTVTASVSGSWSKDDYIDSPLGLQQAVNWSAGFDLGWSPSQNLTLSAGYVHEYIFQKQLSRNRIVSSGVTLDFPDYNWLSNNIDTVDTFYIGAKMSPLPGRLDWNVGMNYSLATGETLTRNPNGAPSSGTGSQNDTATAKRMPAFEDSLIRIDTSLRYYLSKSWTLGLAYAFEKFSKHDWRTDTLNPFLPGATSSIWLGADSRDYTAHILAMTLGYRFK
jgi:MtrB/PioB family decaheme-associated outer membrane protein